jgi:hypothetical protein
VPRAGRRSNSNRPGALGSELSVADALPHCRWELIDGAGHNDLFLVGGNALWDMLADFVQQR